MKSVKNILAKPFLFIPIIIVLWTVIVLFEINPVKYYKLFFIMTSISLLSSLLVIGFQKKWLKLIYSSFLYLILFIVIGLFTALSNLGDFGPEFSKEIGNDEFYRKEIKNRTSIEIPSSFRLTEKIDTIRYMGFEYEYVAICIYKGPSNSIDSFKKKIKNNKNFKQITDSSDRTVNVTLENKTIDLSSYDSWYIYEDLGRFKIKVSFSKDAMYYDAFYY